MAVSYHQMGAVAQARGSYDEALDWYRKSLRIKEELGNRAGMASSYHQMGRVAQARGSYDEALDWYRKSLRIKEELGNRAGMANSLSQMGVLFTARGAPEEAVPLSLRSLALCLELRVPHGINLYWLGRQRAALGEDRFRELVVESVGEESLESVLGMLDQYAASQDDASASGGKAARPGVKPESR